jgi:hypothetical protein
MKGPKITGDTASAILDGRGIIRRSKDAIEVALDLNVLAQDFDDFCVHRVLRKCICAARHRLLPDTGLSARYCASGTRSQPRI